MLVLITGRERTEAQWQQLYGAAGFEIRSITPMHDNHGMSMVEGLNISIKGRFYNAKAPVETAVKTRAIACAFHRIAVLNGESIRGVAQGAFVKQRNQSDGQRV